MKNLMQMLGRGNKFELIVRGHRGYNSVVECLRGMHKALDSILSVTKLKTKRLWTS